MVTLNRVLFSFFLCLYSFTLLGQTGELRLKPLANTDTSEEEVTTGRTEFTSSDLELGGYDKTVEQIAAIRFPNVTIPLGAVVTSAYIQFTVDEDDSENANVIIKAEKGNANTYSTTFNDISNRSYTNTSVTWSAPIWENLNDRLEAQRTADLSSLVNEVLQAGFNANNALAFIFYTDSKLGEKTAETYSTNGATVPELVINYLEEPVEVVDLSNILVLNELTGSGTAQLNDDWVELYNTSNAIINLEGVSLSDKMDEPFKFVFKERYSSGKSFVLVETEDYFNIKSSGEPLYLFQTINGVTSLLDTLEARETDYTSYGRRVDGSDEIVDFLESTPGASNIGSKEFLNIEFSRSRGLYTSSISLALSAPEGSSIRYTTNSDRPSATSGTLYNGPIQINNNTVIKAVAYSSNASSKVVTSTYIINSDAGYQQVPIVSVSSSNSLTSKSKDDCTFEYIDKYGSEGGSAFADALFRAVGNVSVDVEQKKNYRFNFKGELGYPKFNHPIFEKIDGDDYSPVKSFNSLDLKQGQDYNGRYGLGGTNMSEKLGHDYMRQMGKIEVHVRHVHVFLNGKYHGVYNLREHYSNTYAEDYFGGDKDNYDRLDGAGPNVVSNWDDNPTITKGSDDQWKETKSFATSNFQELKKRVDIPEFINFMLFHFQADFEWEYRATVDKEFKASKFRFHFNDLDGFIRRGPPSGVSVYTEKLSATSGEGPGKLFYLAGFGGSNLEYETMVKDRVLTLFDENNPEAVFTVKNYTERTNKFREQYRKYNKLEFDRWGESSSSFESKTNDYISYLPTRFRKVKEFLDGKDLVHNYDFVNFSEPTGSISANTKVTISNPNNGTQVYYAIGGDDVVFDNAPSGILYTSGAALPLVEGVNVVKSRAYSNGNFGPLKEVVYNVISPLNITGINYHPDVDDSLEEDDFEFVLITNNSTEVRSIAQDSIKGMNFKFPEGAFINGGETVMIAKSDEVYPDLDYRRILWLNDGKLSNKGEKLTWKLEDKRVINLLEYDDKEPWPVDADGDGYYLKLEQDDLDNSIAENWVAVPLPSPISTLSIEEFNLNNSVSVFPIPVNNQLNIKLNTAYKNVDVTIYDIAGNTLLEKKSKTNKEVQIDVSSFASGVYILKLELDNNQVLRKVVKN